MKEPNVFVGDRIKFKRSYAAEHRVSSKDTFYDRTFIVVSTTKFDNSDRYFCTCTWDRDVCEPIQKSDRFSTVGSTLMKNVEVVKRVVKFENLRPIAQIGGDMLYGIFDKKIQVFPKSQFKVVNMVADKLGVWQETVDKFVGFQLGETYLDSEAMQEMLVRLFELGVKFDYVDECECISRLNESRRA